MSQHKERVFKYPKYYPFRVVELNPEIITPDECREILSSHVGINSTFFIEADATTTDIIHPQAFIDAKNLDPTDQQNFLTRNVNAIKNAKRVFIKTPILRLYSN